MHTFTLVFCLCTVYKSANTKLLHVAASRRRAFATTLGASQSFSSPESPPSSSSSPLASAGSSNAKPNASHALAARALSSALIRERPRRALALSASRVSDDGPTSSSKKTLGMVACVASSGARRKRASVSRRAQLPNAEIGRARDDEERRKEKK